MGGKVGENPAALRAAVFSLASKNLRGGGGRSNAPPAGRGLNDWVPPITRVTWVKTFHLFHATNLSVLNIRFSAHVTGVSDMPDGS